MCEVLTPDPPTGVPGAQESSPLNDQTFDAAYYERFYFAEATRVADPDYYPRLARFITAYLGVLGW